MAHQRRIMVKVQARNSAPFKRQMISNICCLGVCTESDGVIKIIGGHTVLQAQIIIRAKK